VKLHSWTSFVAFPPQNERKQGEPWQFDSRSLKEDSDITKCLMEQNRRNMEQLLLLVLLTVFIHCKGLACAAITVSQILNTKASSETRETRKWYFRPSSERDQSLVSWCRISGIPYDSIKTLILPEHSASYIFLFDWSCFCTLTLCERHL